METGDRLRAARERLGLKQSELAAKLGVSAATVTLWENHRNRRQISSKHLQKVADALGIRLSDLLGEDERREAPLNIAETQLLRLFRLMPEELKLVPAGNIRRVCTCWPKRSCIERRSSAKRRHPQHRGQRVALNRAQFH